MILTVIIRDDAPFIHLQASPSYRSVRIALTEDQMARLSLVTNGNSESFDRCFIEPTQPAEGE